MSLKTINKAVFLSSFGQMTGPDLSELGRDKWLIETHI